MNAATGMILTTRVTVRDFWMHTVYEHILENESRHNFIRYKRMMREYVIPYIGDMEVRDISTNDLDVLLKKAAGVSVWDARVLKAFLNKMFYLAVQRGIRPDDPAADAVLYACSIKEPARFSDDMNVMLFKLFRRSSLKNVLIFQLVTGLSRAEVLGLRAGGIDFYDGTIKIDQFYNSTGGVHPFISGESHTNTVRTIKIPQIAVDTLLEELEIRESKRSSCSGEWRNDHDLVFTADDGGPVSPHEYRCEIEKLRSEYGIKIKGFQDTQHNFGIIALEQGVNSVELNAYLGCRTFSAVIRYERAMGKTKEKEEEMLDGLYRG